MDEKLATADKAVHPLAADYWKAIVAILIGSSIAELSALYELSGRWGTDPLWFCIFIAAVPLVLGGIVMVKVLKSWRSKATPLKSSSD